MPPKRINAHDGQDRPSKKTKQTNEEEEEQEEEDGQVDWAILKAKRKQTADEKHTVLYAQRLYAQNPETLRSRQTPLQDAQIRTPIYKRKNTNDMADGDANQSSAALRNFFNEIKRASVDEPEGRYRFANLERHFLLGDENTALALSRAAGNEVLVMTEGRRLEV
jgi:hypothetical protein